MDTHSGELAALAAASGAIEPLPEAARRRVVQWLADAFAVELTAAAPVASHDAAPSTSNNDGTRARGRKRGGAKAAAGNGGQVQANKPKASPSFDKALNLHPADKESFKDFVAEKQPSDNALEHNVVAAYWLSQVAEVGAVTADQIFTCYRGIGWKLPGDLRNSLQKTASMKGWLDTRDTDDIKVVSHGLNFINLELPHAKKAK